MNLEQAYSPAQLHAHPRAYRNFHNLPSMPHNLTMAEERRKSPRKKAVIPVKIMDGGSSQPIHTLDIGTSGVRLGGLRGQLKVGETIVLHRGVKNAKFRIVWIRQLTPHEIHAGVEALENQNSLFGLGMSQGTQAKVNMTL